MGKKNRIEINFPFLVDFPDGIEEVLHSLVDMICKKYEKENPSRVMWPAGHGARVHWSSGKIVDAEREVYCIDVSEREDYYGNNENNPDMERLMMEADKLRKMASEESMKRRVERYIDDQKGG